MLIAYEPRLLRVLQLQPNLRQQSDQQLVHVVIDAHRRLDELALVQRGK